MATASFAQPVTIYYDGACHVCVLEIDVYKKKDRRGALRFVDIARPEFRAETHGLDPVRVQKFMHVRDGEGNLRVGVDAFVAIWEALEGFGWMANLAKKKWVNPFLQVGYHTFARIRPFLPKKKVDCDTGACAR